MFSYEKRLQSFKDWPSEFRKITKKLAIAGQYSTNHETRSTKCFYCDKEHHFWNVDCNPYIEHFKKVGTECALYKLHILKARKDMAKGIFLSESKQDLLADKFMYVNIDDNDVLACMLCGSCDKTHRCNKKRIPKITKNIDVETSCFFVKYFSGYFIDAIDSYLENKAILNKEQKETLNNEQLTTLLNKEQKEILLNNEQKEMLNFLLNENDLDNCLVTLDEFIDKCADKIYHDLERKMKSIESSAVENIYNESMIL